VQNFSFTSQIWLYPASKAAWFFVTLPKDISEEIKFLSKLENAGKRRGWGAVKVQAKIGGSVWETSIFPDSKSGCYILPIKSSIREKESITVRDDATIELSLTSQQS